MEKISMERENLTGKQLDKNGRSDTAIFLPALSSFYGTYVGKQQSDPNYIQPNRVPANFENGVEGLNWLNDKQGYFTYKWSLYSAGHADLDVNRVSPKEDMIRKRDRATSFVLGDSGGFQIGKTVWEGDWKNPACPRAQKKREQVLSWMDAYMDYGMILDIPAWVRRNPEAADKVGITSYQDAIDATCINNDYFMANRSGDCKFLNVLQGEHHTDANVWYQAMKHYNDSAQHERPFEGWAMGGQLMCSPTLALKMILKIRNDKLLEKGKHDWMHFLGTSKLEWALFLTDIQRAVRKYHNENFTISFDCASPFLATANGQIYTNNEYTDKQKWVYRMEPSVDNKKYATDMRSFSDAVLNDKIFKKFEDSPISKRLLISDICKYAPGDLNKIGKEGKTSWDSFSYALQMGHNVYQHIAAVQEANRLYESKIACPKMLIGKYTGTFVSDIVDSIFASDTATALEIIKYYDKFLTGIIGTRGNTGKKEANSNTVIDSMFEFSDHPGSTNIVQPKNDPEFDESLLDELEQMSD